SGGSDFTLLRQFSARPSVINLDVLLAFAHLLGGPTYQTGYGGAPFARVEASAAYSRLQGLFSLIVQLAYLLYAAGHAMVTALAITRAMRTWRAAGLTGARGQGWRQQLAALWRGLQSEPAWRAELVLWLWLTLPALALLRHNKSVQPHYLFIVYPALFLAAGLALARASTLGEALSGLRERLAVPRLPQVPPAVAPAAALVLLGALVVGQASQSLLYTAAQAGGQVDNTTYGYPLGELRNADATLARLQHEAGAHGVLLSTPQPYFYSALDYLLVREHPDRIRFFGSCLLLPGEHAGPTLLVSTEASSPAAALIPQLAGVRHLQSIGMPGVEPFQVYALGEAPAPAGETALRPAEYRGPGGERLQL